MLPDNEFPVMAKNTSSHFAHVVIGPCHGPKSTARTGIWSVRAFGENVKWLHQETPLTGSGAGPAEAAALSLKGGP